MLQWMDRQALHNLLVQVSSGSVTPDNALKQLRDFPVAQLEGASLDMHRQLRRGFPEVVLAEGKSDAELRRIIERLYKADQNLLVTRLDASRADYFLSQFPDDSAYHRRARLLAFRKQPFEDLGRGTVAVVTAGTSDRGAGNEAAVTLEFMGNRVVRIDDVGVAGLHRILPHLDTLRDAEVVIICAGMEGALTSVLAGLVDRPIIAVPTSIGYGAHFGGLAALLGMLNSCAAGVSVVNIDNGFGAAYSASLINRKRSSGTHTES